MDYYKQELAGAQKQTISRLAGETVQPDIGPRLALLKRREIWKTFRFHSQHIYLER